MQAQGDIGVFGGVIQGRVKGDEIKRHLFPAAARDLREFYVGMAEMTARQFIQAMAVLFARIQHVGQHHGVVHRRDIDTVTGENVAIIFDIVPDLEHRRIGQHRRQQFKRTVAVDLAGEQRTLAAIVPAAIA